MSKKLIAKGFAAALAKAERARTEKKIADDEFMIKLAERERKMRANPERTKLIGKIQAWAHEFVQTDEYKAVYKLLNNSPVIYSGSWGHGTSIRTDWPSDVSLGCKGTLRYSAGYKYGSTHVTTVSVEGNLCLPYLKLLWASIKNEEYIDRFVKLAKHIEKCDSIR